MTQISRDERAEEFRRIPRHLSQLVFNPVEDVRPLTVPGVAEYLRFYNLEFPAIPGLVHRMGICNLHGFQLACHYWLPDKARGAVFIVHGYFDHVGLCRHLVANLLQRGLAVVAFDLPGHGLSSGERISIESFERYVEVYAGLLSLAGNSLPEPWYGVGQSTGGTIILKYMMTRDSGLSPNRLEQAALLAPLIYPERWRTSLVVYWLTHRFRTGVKRVFMENSSDRAFLDFVKYQDPLQEWYIPVAWLGAMENWMKEFRRLPRCDFPFVVIQGDRDTTLDWRHNMNLLDKKLPAAEIRIIAGAGHQLINESPQLRQQVFELLPFPT